MEIVHQLIGVLMKIGYAFLWQESIFGVPILYKHDITRWLGADLMLLWNKKSSEISGFIQTDDAVITSDGLYPGVFECR
jgi:hypothetical protein